MPHKSGFVSLVGKPNVGKSTLMNALVGEKLSIITYKAQTTRHRIFGILNGADFQIVYSDTPGILEPKYALHKAMMNFVNMSLEDADIILLVIDIRDVIPDENVLATLKKAEGSKIILLNKCDLAEESFILDQILLWKQAFPDVKEIFPVSGLKNIGLDKLFKHLIDLLPEHPPFYPKDQLTEQSERFFASEIIREKIFLLYDEEIPYSCEVVIDSFKDKEDILVIQAIIFVERPTQKSIIIGKGGTMLKKLGIAARKDLEDFFGKKVFLETYLKVDEDWRNRKSKLSRFGYFNE